MIVTVKVKCDNAAFQDDPGELARILRELANAAECGPEFLRGCILFDANGNRVGKADCR